MQDLERTKRLLESLVPRALSYCLYDADRQRAWSSDGSGDSETDNVVRQLPNDALQPGDAGQPYVRRTLKSGRTLLLLPLEARRETAAGLLAVVFPRNIGQSSSFDPEALSASLRPALDVIAESLQLRRDAGAGERGKERVERELKFIYELDEQVLGKSRSNTGLARLVAQAGRHLEVCYSVLLIPSKRIRISATHSSWKRVNRKILDRYLVEQIVPQIEGQRGPVIYEMSSEDVPGGKMRQGYQALICPVMDHNGQFQGVLAQLGRVSARPFTRRHRKLMSNVVRKAEYMIEQSFDPMTGLMNRAGFESQLHESWRTLPDATETHQLIYLDLDNLQLVNDMFGRKAGDAVITRFARLLEEDLPRSAVLSRLTGDDFCILLTQASDEAAVRLATDIRKRSNVLRYLEGDKSLQITVSVGIAAFSHLTGDETKALTSARMACDAAKDHGRDRIEVYNLDNQSMIRRHDDMQLVADIQQALDGDEFELLAQPIEALGRQGGRRRFEILLRMKDRDGNRVPSGAFFSAAERYQMMPQIDRWVVSATIAALRECCETIAGGSALFSINLSGQSLGDDEILSFIEDEIRSASIPVEAIGFEVTESAAVSNLAKAQDFINALHERGCRISLDDFGAGLSSFAYLKNFRVDTLKIDGSFIRDITDNRISESMVAAITQVAKVMDLDTVAEYVEQEKTRKLIAKLGVDYAQGHAVGKPRPLGEVLAGLADYSSISKTGR